MVRKLNDEIVRRVKLRASAAERSAEAEHRAILDQAPRPPRTGLDLLRDMRANGPHLTDEEIELIESLGSQPAEVADLFD